MSYLTPKASGSNVGLIKLAGDLGGTATEPKISAIQGVAFDNNLSTTVHDGYVLAYDVASSKFIAIEKVGPQGHQGFQGIVGTQGNDGSQGPQGNDGSQGFQGTQGFQGDTGTQGFQGETGATGGDGPQASSSVYGTIQLSGDLGGAANEPHVVGLRGVAIASNLSSTVHDGYVLAYDSASSSFIVTEKVGTTGPQGSTGAQGADGSKGPQGNDGSGGPQGPDGGLGPQGDPGPQGDAGPQGNDGAQGSQGHQGDSGPQGSAGPQGAIGAQGGGGEQGAQGYQGFQGFQGTQGLTGDTGVQGATGSQGPQGFQGDIGNQGSTGAQGSQGHQGDVGSTGSQGNQGFQGSTGSQGNQGFQGATGATGPKFLQTVTLLNSGPTTYQMSGTDVLVVDSSIAAYTVKLPTAPSVGDVIAIKDAGNASTNAVIITLDNTSTYKIDGGNSINIDINYGSIMFLYAGTILGGVGNWVII
jgi:hypothetical protein